MRQVRVVTQYLHDGAQTQHDDDSQRQPDAAALAPDEVIGEIERFGFHDHSSAEWSAEAL